MSELRLNRLRRGVGQDFGGGRGLVKIVGFSQVQTGSELGIEVVYGDVHRFHDWGGHAVLLKDVCIDFKVLELVVDVFSIRPLSTQPR